MKHFKICYLVLWFSHVSWAQSDDSFDFVDYVKDSVAWVSASEDAVAHLLNLRSQGVDQGIKASDFQFRPKLYERLMLGMGLVIGGGTAELTNSPNMLIAGGVSGGINFLIMNHSRHALGRRKEAEYAGIAIKHVPIIKNAQINLRDYLQEEMVKRLSVVLPGLQNFKQEIDTKIENQERYQKQHERLQRLLWMTQEELLSEIHFLKLKTEGVDEWKDRFTESASNAYGFIQNEKIKTTPVWK